MSHATLFHPFVSGILPLPEKGTRTLFLGAQPPLHLPPGFSPPALVQGFRPAFLDLARSGHTVTPTPEGKAFDTALVAFSRHRGENMARLHEALSRLRVGGLLVAGGSKTEGADSLRKAVAKLLPLEDHAAKHHGTVFWLRRPETLPEWPLEIAEPVPGFRTAPGMFSFERVDAGSRLLAQHLPGDFKGRVADFCSGWGFLAREAARLPGITHLDLFEADWASLEAARQALEPLSDLALGFHWSDLLREAPEGSAYDAILMNPPFHTGRAADPALGQGMIAAASRSLRRGGRLVIVANRGLPYEAPLRAGFASVEKLAEEGGFIVFAARR